MTKGRGTAASMVLVLIAGGAGSALAAVRQEGRVLPGIESAGLPLGNLDGELARKRLAAAAAALESRPITLRAGNRTFVLTPRDMGVRVSVDSTLDRVLAAGRGGPVDWFLHTVAGTSTRVSVVATLDSPRWSATLAWLRARVRSEPSEGEIIFTDGVVKAVGPGAGGELLAEPATRAILAAVTDPVAKKVVELPLSSIPPLVSPDQLTRVEDQARQILSEPLTFFHATGKFSLAPEVLARSLRVRLVEDPESPSSRALVLQIDPIALASSIAEAVPHLVSAPRDAGFAIRGTKVQVIGSKPGIGIDGAAIAPWVKRAGLDPARPSVEIELTSIHPEFSTEDAASLRIVERIATFSTGFDPSNVPRVANIDRMADEIDGTILRPGETFSLNSATGPRTPENGYQEAQVIVDGELVPGIGGGVCQVATTLFNAAFGAGLEVTERINHSLHISKYPLGRDATVNYGHQDLKFRNDTPYGVLFEASVSSRGMTVSLYSSPTGRVVDVQTSPRRNPKPPDTKYIDDPGLPAGTEIVEEEGSAGFDVTVVRKVTAGGQVLHEDTFVSKYRPWKRIIRRGTGPPSAPAV